MTVQPMSPKNSRKYNELPANCKRCSPSILTPAIKTDIHRNRVANKTCGPKGGTYRASPWMDTGGENVNCLTIPPNHESQPTERHSSENDNDERPHGQQEERRIFRQWLKQRSCKPDAASASPTRTLFFYLLFQCAKFVTLWTEPSGQGAADHGQTHNHSGRS